MHTTSIHEHCLYLTIFMLTKMFVFVVGNYYLVYYNIPQGYLVEIETIAWWAELEI